MIVNTEHWIIPEYSVYHFCHFVLNGTVNKKIMNYFVLFSINDHPMFLPFVLKFFIVVIEVENPYADF